MNAETSWQGKLPACRRKYPLIRVRWPGPPSPHRHLGLAPDMVVLFLQTDLGGGTGCQGRSPARTERRWWILISCGPATGVGQGSTSTGPAATPRRRAPGVATGSARRHSSPCAGKRQMCRKTCCSDARAWQERASDYWGALLPGTGLRLLRPVPGSINVTTKQLQDDGVVAALAQASGATRNRWLTEAVKSARRHNNSNVALKNIAEVKVLRMWRPLARAHTSILGRYTEYVWYNLLKRNFMYIWCECVW